MTSENRKPDEYSQISQPDQLLIAPSTSTSSKTSIGSKKKLTRFQIPRRTIRKAESIVQLAKPRLVVKKRYFTAGVGIDESNKIDLSKEPSPFQYPKDLAVFAQRVKNKAWRHDAHIQQLHAKCANKPSFKDRQKQDLLRRLYVEEPEVGNLKTVLDIAPEYFKIVEGRPIPDRLSIHQYVDTVRDSLRTKIVNGFREDDILLIEENLLLEQKLIDSIRANYNQYVSIFEEFLYRDHTTSMQCLKDADAAAMEAFDKYEEYKTVAKKYAAARSTLYQSETKWKNSLMYQKFLFLVSPFSWRMQKKNPAEQQQEGEETDEDQFLKCLEQLEDDQEVSVSDLLDQFKQEHQVSDTPDLYFTQPEQLMEVFRFMEMQNLNSLLHTEELALPLEQINEGIRVAEEAFDKEIINLQDMINKLEGGINWAEDRANYLEEFATNLIGNEFKHLIADDAVLNLHVFVEDVYESRIGPNDANLTMADMMKAIEVKYRHELLLLDKIPAHQVAQLEQAAYTEQMTIMKLAETAAKQFAELEMITGKLNKALAPPPPRRMVRELKNRSPPIVRKKTATVQRRELTDEEMEYLDYFTDFCKYTDNPKDYGINPVMPKS